MSSGYHIQKRQRASELREAAVRPVLHNGPGFKRLFILLSIIVLAGVVAYGYQFMHGLGVTGLNNTVFWGVYFTDFIAFIGISYGGAIVSAVLRLTGSSWRAPITRMAEALALVALVIGGAFAVIDMGRPDRIWHFFISPNFGSPVMWDLLAITTYLIATIIFFTLPLIPDFALCRESMGQRPGWRQRLYERFSMGWQGLPAQKQRLAFGTGIMSILIIPLAISVHSVMAWAFAVTSREGWHSTIFGPYYVVAALFSGVAAVILVVMAFRKAYHLQKWITDKQIRYLGFLMVALGAIYLYFTFSEFLTEGFVMSEGAVPLLESLLLKNYAPLFWFFVFAVGVVPLAVMANRHTRTAKFITIASALVVVGMWIKRLLIVVPPLRIAVIPAETLSYSPTWVEIMITVAAAAAIPLFLMIIFKVVPVMSVYEIEEVAEAEHAYQPAIQTQPAEEGGRS